MAGVKEGSFQRLDTWLERLLAAPLSTRDELLAQCDDAGLRRELQSLLAGDADAGPLDRVPLQLATRALARSAEHARAGSTLGGYRLLDLLGEGGMAVVWRTERGDGAIAREVALKCLKIGLA